MISTGQPGTCRHCGAARGLTHFCSACGCRLAGRPPGVVRAWAVAIGVALMAAPLMVLSLVMGSCGCVATVAGLGSFGAATLLTGLVMLVIGYATGQYAKRLMRTGQARIEGCREVSFGRRNRRRT